jgi:hypothetical protein
MKTTLLTLSALAVFTFTPRPAQALGDTEAAILGGVIGGAILGLAIDQALDDDYVEVHHNYYRGGRYDNDYSYGRGHRHGPDCRCNTCRPRRACPPSGGYWSYRTVKVWVPKRVWFTYDDCGRRVKHFRRGHWTYRKEKVWVSGYDRW